MTDTGVSDAELAALIAGLQATPATPAIPAHVMAEGGPDHYAAGQAQALYDAITSADWAAVQRIADDPWTAGEDVDTARGALACAPPPYGPALPLPPERERPALGPWFAATYKGECADCGTSFAEFDFIRADGEGGWLAECCSERNPRPADGIITAPAPAQRPAGPPPSTVKELRGVLIDYEASRPRTMQTALGPSELGTPCQQQIARKLAGAPRRPITEPTWAPFQGTAVHASMEDVVAFWNKQLGRERWLAEDNLTVIESAPAQGYEYPTVAGHGDAFDLDHGMVVDWKYVGTTALDKLRAGKRLGKPTAEQVSAEYRVQAHLYGMGHANKGRNVRHVRLVLLARSWKYDDSDEWTEPYDEAIARSAIDRYWSVVDLLHDLGGTTAGDLIAAVPATPGKDVCKWCPFYAPGQATSWGSCAGDRPPAAHVERATSGLIEGAA